MARPLILILGGTRSGKSRHALDVTRRLAGPGTATVLATALRGDPEMEQRIARHQAHRPATWSTIEVGSDLPGAVRRAEPGRPILVEGLTLWLSALIGDDPADPDPILAGPVEAAIEAIRAHDGPVVIVSDEIGLGMVPMHAGARAFRDLVGLVHQRFAAEAHEVELVVAGLPLNLKSSTRP